ncbi:hypothetical protein CGCA056_v003422 [Colletotrichum aenigma]|uniref:uncharacterized protein n=1 Tax=Colletotrichum aenigma TaxID=1215731 RepID=UPI001873257C|nr:uncharacterized protein CGCA056_v003422 [Colletotrichum aenigma]KAF5525330.1 hypothetical protein CGCA056_v003422 [Colletotrichum aenigma]
MRLLSQQPHLLFKLVLWSPRKQVNQGTITPDLARGTIKTITTGPTSRPVTTTREAFFSATTNAAADIDISIINPALESFLENAAQNAPACGLKRRAYCGARAFVDHFETQFDKSVEVIQDLEEAIMEGAPKHPIKIEVEKAIDLTNAEGEAEAVPDVAFSIMSEGEVTAVEAGAPAAIGALGVGFLAYAFHIYGSTKSSGSTKPLITGIHVPSASLKAVKQTKRPTKTATISTRSSTSTKLCPDPTKTPLWCGDYPEKQDCDMQLPQSKEKPPTCKSGDYQGCKCNPPTIFEGAVVSQEELAAMAQIQELFKTLPKEFPKLPNYGECSKKMENMDPKIFKILSDKFCTDNFKLDKDVSAYYTPADVSINAYNRYSFTLDWKKSGKDKCSNQCRQIFDEGFTTNTACSYDSHTMAHNGTLALDCGVASFEIFNPDTASSGPTCKNDASPIPYNVFSGSDGIIYKEFCQEWDAKSGLRMVVDSKGTSKIPKPQLGRRTPPASQDTWLKYNFELNYKPETGAQAGAQCKVTCKDAFTAFANSKCGQKGGQGNTMANYAEYDAGCGKFSYQITKPVPKTLGEPKCFGTDEFGDHEDINPSFQEQYVGHVCTGSALRNITKGDSSTFIHFDTITNKAPYQMNVYWADGCSLETTEENILLWKPLGDLNAANCASLLLDSYKKCNNEGAGGRIQAGCLVYEFKASTERPSWYIPK